MFFWTALYIEDNLEEVRDQAIRIGEQTGAKCPLVFLPLHVSLKISFNIDASHSEECMALLKGYFSKIGPFNLDVIGYEHVNGVIWIRFAESPRLAEIHSRLDEMIEQTFGVAPNELDLKFIYHCTLFMDDDDKLIPAMEEITKVPLPSKILAREFLIGASEDGLPGTYSVMSHSRLGPEVDVKEQWDKFKEKTEA
ncbi:MAG: hypothetical protein J5891_01495 [Spirochaetales bacterium]|nr:hypothetical protein [Spirochaetales bacterium]